MLTLIQPVMLAALPLALLPVLLRLLRRTGPLPEIPFSATWLLEKAAAAEQIRMRRRDLLLIVTRILMLVLLIVGFARPTRMASPTPSPAGKTGESAILFLDETSAFTTNQIGARLIGVTEGSARVSPGPYYHPALALFDEPAKGDLRHVHARKWWKIEPVGHTVVMARFDNGDPFLLEHWTEANERVIICTVARDHAWSDLLMTPNYIPMLDSVNRYLSQPISAATDEAPVITRDYSPWCFVLVILLGLSEIALGGWSIGKGVILVFFGTLAVHPTLPWPSRRPPKTEVLLVVDQSPSMQVRADAVNRIVGTLPQYPRANLTGSQTSLGTALDTTGRASLSAIILVSDGQHNQGIAPSWVAARNRIPIYPIAVGPISVTPDTSILSIDAPLFAWPGEKLFLTANFKTTGENSDNLRASIAIDNNVVLSTNILSGMVTLPLPSLAPGTHQGELRIAVNDRDTTPANNTRPFQVTVFPRNIRVALESDKIDWEFRHILHAMRRDPAVELLTDAAQADVVIKTDGETWRMRRDGPNAFQEYWSRRIRLEWLAKQRITLPTPPSVSEELYRLDRNDALLAEIARVSGGRMFNEDTLPELPQALDAPARRASYDLRQSWLVLLGFVAYIIATWLSHDKRPSPLEGRAPSRPSAMEIDYPPDKATTERGPP